MSNLKTPTLLDSLPFPKYNYDPNEKWHLKSIKEDLINEKNAELFYERFGSKLYSKIKENISGLISIQDVINELASEASQYPAIDWEDQLLASNKDIDFDLTNWRKEKFWNRNVENIVEALLDRAQIEYKLKIEEFDRKSKMSDDERLLDNFGLL